MCLGWFSMPKPRVSVTNRNTRATRQKSNFLKRQMKFYGTELVSYFGGLLHVKYLFDKRSITWYSFWAKYLTRWNDASAKEEEGEMKKDFFRVFFFLILLSALGCTAPLYVECQDLYPDEYLDLFGISDPASALTTILSTHLAIFPVLISNDPIFRRHYSRTFSLHPFTSELVLAVSLRC